MLAVIFFECCISKSHRLNFFFVVCSDLSLSLPAGGQQLPRPAARVDRGGLVARRAGGVAQPAGRADAGLGHLPRLRVLNLVENRVQHLPVSLLKLTQLQALWLSARQGAPLVQLHKEYSVDSRRRVLSCFLLPQRPEDEDEALVAEQQQQ